MRNLCKAGMCALILIAWSANGYGQQSTPPPATDYAPAAPGSISASPTTDAAAPAAGVTSGPNSGVLGDRANEQSAAAASPSSTTDASPGAFPPTYRPLSPLDQQLGSGVGAGGSSAGQAAGQPGELGVWMVESSGPGVHVRRITEGSAADMAGLQPGDVILEINGQSAASPHGVAQMIRQIPAGQAATVQFWRDGRSNELQIVLQPVREQYEVGFRGDESVTGTSRPSGDLETRTMRLEGQLAMVLQELRQLRQEMAQLRGSGSAPTAIGGGAGEATTATGLDAGTSTGTTPAAATPPASAVPQPDRFEAATEPAAQPDAAPAATPATEPATGDDELFDISTTEAPATTEPATEEATPAEGEATPEAAPAEGASDDLLE